MKIGVIFCGYGTREYVHMALSPWADLRRGSDVLICAVSVKFAGFDGEDDGTRQFLSEQLKQRNIDYLIDGPDDVPETTARGMALEWLKKQGADMVIQWDADEIASVEELNAAIRFMSGQPFVTAFKFSYRNLVFTPDQWLADPFTPMRAHWVKEGSYEAHQFWDDNNIIYRGTITRDFRRDTDMSVMTIPEAVFNPTHWTWLNTERSKKKVAYQVGRGWNCSFAWDDSKGGLIFNPALPAPKVVRATPETKT